MGFLKRVFKPVRKVAKKIIPKEVRPFLPYIAATFGPAGLAGTKFATMNPAFQKALIAGLTSAATDERGNPLRAAVLAGAPDALSQGLGGVAEKYGAVGDSAEKFTFASKVADVARAGQQGIEGAGALKTIGAQTAIDQAAKFADIRQDELDEYNRQLEEQGILSKKKRRQGIYDIYIAAGYDPDYTNSVLDKYGYAAGGNVKKAGGANFESYKDFIESTGDDELMDLYVEFLQTGDFTKLGQALDRKGYDEGGIAAQFKDQLRALMSKMKAPESIETIAKGSDRFRRKQPKDKKEKPIIEIKEGEEVKVDDEGGSIIRSKPEPDFARAMVSAMRGVEDAFGIPFSGVAPVEFKRFAKGGEVEIEEETDDLSIMDFMKDQGIPYGEQASYGYNEAMSDTYDAYLDMKKKGLIPPTMDFQEFLLEVVPEMSKRRNEGIMQMASGYKTDMEEMYEQYVFEMEEMGLQPMSFSQFVEQAKAGMKDGGKAQRRKKGEPKDDDGEKPGPRRFPKFEDKRLYEEKMPQVMPGNKPDMMDAAMGGIANLAAGGSAGSRYSFLINKQKQGVLTPDEEQELLQLEMMFADDSQGMKDGGIMEKDMRGGGFIPEGSKERADDVPARLSKNEFVMTADAVRAAGGGSVNKGAKRMYDLMYNLEGRI